MEWGLLVQGYFLQGWNLGMLLMSAKPPISSARVQQPGVSLLLDFFIVFRSPHFRLQRLSPCIKGTRATTDRDGGRTQRDKSKETRSVLLLCLI